MGRAKAVEILTSLVHQVPLIERDRIVIKAALATLESGEGELGQAAEQLRHVVKSVPLTEEPYQTALAACDLLSQPIEKPASRTARRKK